MKRSKSKNKNRLSPVCPKNISNVKFLPTLPFKRVRRCITSNFILFAYIETTERDHEDMLWKVSVLDNNWQLQCAYSPKSKGHHLDFGCSWPPQSPNFQKLRATQSVTIFFPQKGVPLAILELYKVGKKCILYFNLLSQKYSVSLSLESLKSMCKTTNYKTYYGWHFN